VLHDFSSVGRPTVPLVKGKLSVQDFEGCQGSVSPTSQCRSSDLGHPPGVPLLKVHYF
jgi:hypothetical protein